jgi:ABC-type dipeptide/oligopeptide/nickel transport system permease component
VQAQLGLDQPLYTQYFIYVGKILSTQVIRDRRPYRTALNFRLHTLLADEKP